MFTYIYNVTGINHSRRKVRNLIIDYTLESIKIKNLNL